MRVTKEAVIYHTQHPAGFLQVSVASVVALPKSVRSRVLLEPESGCPELPGQHRVLSWFCRLASLFSAKVCNRSRVPLLGASDPQVKGLH